MLKFALCPSVHRRWLHSRFAARVRQRNRNRRSVHNGKVLSRVSILVFLGLAWSAFLIRTAGRWLSSRSADSVADFGRRLSRLSHHSAGSPVGSLASLGRTPVGYGMPTGPRSVQLAANRARRARKRRRDVFLALCALAVGSLVLGLLPGFSALLTLHVAVDALLGLYTVALLRRRAAPAPRQAPARLANRGSGPSRVASRVPSRRFAAQAGSYELGAAYAVASGE